MIIDNRLNLTVVICTHNRANLLNKTLESLNAALRPATCNVSLLVIANACSDDTVTTLHDYVAEQRRANEGLCLHYEEEPVTGKSYALNRAINHVDSGFICFVDDDHRVDADYFVACTDAIRSYPDILIFCGQIIPDWTGDEPAWIHDQGTYKIYPMPVPCYEMGNIPTQVGHRTKLPGGGNLIVNKRVFNQVGLFKTTLGPKGHNLEGSEDSDFVIRALNAGVFIQYVPDIIQYHYVDMDRLKLNYLLKKSFERTKTLTKVNLQTKQAMPNYLWRKLLGYFFKACFSFGTIKARFFLMRIASTLGEISAYLGR